jgi:signal peptidase I
MWMICALAAVVTGLVVVRRSYVIVKVAGASMMPTYRDGERVIARRMRGQELRTRDVIAFVPPAAYQRQEDPTYRIKRIVAVAGDPIPHWLREPGRQVPPGKLVVLGDNPNSEDSRRYGYVDVPAVIAIVRAGRR